MISKKEFQNLEVNDIVQTRFGIIELHAISSDRTFIRGYNHDDEPFYIDQSHIMKVFNTNEICKDCLVNSTCIKRIKLRECVKERNL